MTAKDILLLLLTFFIGVFIGAYVYVAYFQPQFGGESLSTSERRATELSIIGEEYGACDDACASFRFLPNGTLQYLPTIDGQVQKHTLPRALFINLTEALTEHTLEAAVQDGSSCDAPADVEHHYTITWQGSVYELDTCTDTFTHTAPLGSALVDVWAYAADQS